MMTKFKILVPIDFSPTAARAFRFALRIGALLDAELHVLHVIYPQMEDIDHPLESSAVATTTRSHLLEKKLETFTMTEKDKWEKEMGPAPKTFIHVEVGSAIAVIKDRAKKHHYDLIIMGTRDKHDSVEHMLGTVASDVVGNATCPVIVVPQQFESKAIAKVAHAVEPKIVSTDAISAIIERYLPIHREVHLIRFGAGTKNESPQELLQFKTHLRSKFPEIKIETHSLDKKDLVRDINQFVTQKEIDLLIMYRSPSSLFQRLFHRSKTRLMARHTQIPLLVI